MKPYYDDGNGIVIYHGDWRDVLPLIKPVDLVVTSPPYNLGGEPWPHLGNWKHGGSAGGIGKWKNGGDAANGIQYGGHNDTMWWPEYVEWQQDFIAAIWNKLNPSGAIFYNHKPRVVGTKLWTPLELVPPCAILRQIIIWARPGGMNFNPAAFVPTHEWIMLLAKPEFRLKSKGVSGLGDVWRMSPDKNPHPAPFPVELPSRCIDATNPRIVLDPNSGSGTTLVAARLHGCSAIGIEKDERWCELAAHRLAQGVLSGVPA